METVFSETGVTDMISDSLAKCVGYYGWRGAAGLRRCVLLDAGANDSNFES